MRFYQEQQYEMIRITTDFLKKNMKKLSVMVPAYKKTIPLLIEKQKELFDLRSGIVNAVKVKTGKKREVRSLLIDSVLKLLAAVEADEPDELLADDEKRKTHTERSLQRATAQNLSRIANEAIESAKTIQNLRQYGLFPGDIDDAQAYLSEFSKTKDAPLKKKKEVGDVNKDITTGIRYCLKLFEKKIDPLMRIVAQNDEALSGKYKSFRTVLPRGQGIMSEREEKYRKSRKNKTMKKVNAAVKGTRGKKSS